MLFFYFGFEKDPARIESSGPFPIWYIKMLYILYEWKGWIVKKIRPENCEYFVCCNMIYTKCLPYSIWLQIK